MGLAIPSDYNSYFRWFVYGDLTGDDSTVHFYGIPTNLEVNCFQIKLQKMESAR